MNKLLGYACGWGRNLYLPCLYFIYSTLPLPFIDYFLDLPHNERQATILGELWDALGFALMETTLIGKHGGAGGVVYIAKTNGSLHKPGL